MEKILKGYSTFLYFILIIIFVFKLLINELLKVNFAAICFYGRFIFIEENIYFCDKEFSNSSIHEFFLLSCQLTKGLRIRTSIGRLHILKLPPQFLNRKHPGSFLVGFTSKGF